MGKNKRIEAENGEKPKSLKKWCKIEIDSEMMAKRLRPKCHRCCQSSEEKSVPNTHTRGKRSIRMLA